MRKEEIMELAELMAKTCNDIIMHRRENKDTEAEIKTSPSAVYLKGFLKALDLANILSDSEIREIEEIAFAELKQPDIPSVFADVINKMDDLDNFEGKKEGTP